MTSAGQHWALVQSLCSQCCAPILFCPILSLFLSFCLVLYPPVISLFVECNTGAIYAIYSFHLNSAQILARKRRHTLINNMAMDGKDINNQMIETILWLKQKKLLIRVERIRSRVLVFCLCWQLLHRSWFFSTSLQHRSNWNVFSNETLNYCTKFSNNCDSNHTKNQII